MDLQSLTKQVESIAISTGVWIANERKNFSRSSVEYKEGQHNMVSYVDKEAETQIVAALRALLPEAEFITEEGSVEQKSGEYQWIIDPLDGTTNFIHSLPPYCVSIGLAHNKKPILGVVYEITTKELFSAYKGGGAWLNGEKICVSDVEKLNDAIVFVGFSYNEAMNSPEAVDRLVYYQRNSDGIRRSGSSTYNTVCIASGRGDGFVQARLNPWDIAAGAIIVEEAGGTVTTCSGDTEYLFANEIVCSNTKIHDELLKPYNE